MSDTPDGASAAQLAAGNAQSYMNNAQSYATQASSAAATASSAALAATHTADALSQQLAIVMALLAGTSPELGALEDTDAVGIGREGQLYNAPYSVLRDLIRAGRLDATNNLSDVEDSAAALANLGGVASSSIKSSMVTNQTTSETVSCSFSFTPGTDGFLSIIAQGGSAGTTSPAVELVISVAKSVGATLLNSDCNGNGTYNLAVFTAQFMVKKGVPVTLTLTQTAPPGTNTNNLSAFFIYLPN
jgi:hypothetical protein